MNTTVAQQPQSRRESNRTFMPLPAVTKSHLTTEEAAYHLGRQTQTLRVWACKDNGPIRPIRVNGRLAWPVQDICALLQQ